MPKVTFFSGSSATAGRQIIDECLLRIDGPRQSFIYVAPTARRARSFENRLLREKRGGFFRPHLLTFHSLMEMLYRRMGGTGVPISASVKAMLIEEIISGTQLRLDYFARSGRPFPGLVHRLAGFISDLKQNLVEPDDFERLTDDLEHPAARRSRELLAIYRCYQQRLEQHELIDTDGMFWLVLKEFNDPSRVRTALHGIDLLIFDSFFDLTVAEARVLEQMLVSGPDVWLRLDYEHDAPAFAAATPFVERFCRSARRIDVPAPPESPATAIPAALFEPTRSARPAAGTVSIFESRDRLAEVEAIAAEIKRLAREPQFDANRVAVAFKNIARYSPLVREVFASCAIAFNCPDGRPLRESPVVAAIMSALDIVRQNFSRESVLAFLRSPYISFRFEHDGRQVELDGDFLDTEARVARIFRGRSTWAEKLQQTIVTLERQPAAPDADEADLQHTAGRIARLEEQRRGIELVLAQIARLEQPMTPKEFAGLLEELIRTFGIARGIFFRHEDAVGRDILERDYRALAAFQQVIKDVMFAAGFAGRESFSFHEFAEMAEAGLAGEMFDIRRDVDHGVNVLPIDELRGGDYDVVFIGGMVDGEFPRPEAPQIFYSEDARRRLGLKTTPSNLDIERYLFATAVAAPRRRTIITYPAADSGKELLKSLFVSEIQRLLPDIEVQHFPQPGSIFSVRSLQYNAARGLLGQDAAAGAELCSRAPGGNISAMVRSLSIEELRRRGSKWSRFEGMLKDPAVRQEVAAKYVRRPLSASTLERYARCPFRFFAEQVLRLAELDEPQEEIDALERGSVMHKILNRFYTERRARGRVELHEDDNPGDALEHIRRIAREELDRMPFEGLFWEMERERILGGRGRGFRGVLEMFIEAEMQPRGTSLPRYFEASFGRPYESEESDITLALPEVVIGEGDSQVRLIGRIDRIDVAEADGRPLALAIDYKTGTPPTSDDVLKYLSLQLPVYMMALQQAEFQPAGGAYYCLKDNPKDFGIGGFFADSAAMKGFFGIGQNKRKGLLDAGELADTIRSARDAILRYAAGIRSARFNPSTLDPQDSGCRYCQFNGICRRNLAKAAQVAGEADDG